MKTVINYNSVKKITTSNDTQDLLCTVSYTENAFILNTYKWIQSIITSIVIDSKKYQHLKAFVWLEHIVFNLKLNYHVNREAKVRLVLILLIFKSKVSPVQKILHKAAAEVSSA